MMCKTFNFIHKKLAMPFTTSSNGNSYKLLARFIRIFFSVKRFSINSMNNIEYVYLYLRLRLQMNHVTLQLLFTFLSAIKKIIFLSFSHIFVTFILQNDGLIWWSIEFRWTQFCSKLSLIREYFLHFETL